MREKQRGGGGVGGKKREKKKKNLNSQRKSEVGNNEFKRQEVFLYGPSKANVVPKLGVLL